MKKKKWKIRNLAVSQERAVHFKPFIFSFGIKSMLPIFSLNSFFFFLSCDLQNLSSLTRDWTWVPTVGAWTVREVPMLSICKPQISQKSIEWVNAVPWRPGWKFGAWNYFGKFWKTLHFRDSMERKAKFQALFLQLLISFPPKKKLFRM